jgi:hypothetical protein
MVAIQADKIVLTSPLCCPVIVTPLYRGNSVLRHLVTFIESGNWLSR